MQIFLYSFLPWYIFSKKTSSEKKSLPDSKREILLPLDWLLKPFRKRFRFHFYGNKQTNSLEKVGTWLWSVCVWIVSHHWLIKLEWFSLVLKIMCLFFSFVLQSNLAYLQACLFASKTCSPIALRSPSFVLAALIIILGFHPWQGCALGKFSGRPSFGRPTMISRSPSLPGWSPKLIN